MRKDDGFLSRRVAVTGSTGMIGSHLVAELVRTGYTDIVLPVRNPGKADRIYRALEMLGVELHEGVINIVKTDLADTAALTQTLAGVDTVFHCAAAIMTGELDERGLIENNVGIARSVADAAIACGVRKILHTSSIVVVCPEGHGHTATEENEPHADETCSAYSQSKFYSDMEMQRAQEAGIELVILYPAVVIGEGDWSLNGSSAMVPLISRGLPVYADGVMGYVDVRDVARAYVALDSHPGAAGQSFIISGENLSYRQLISYGATAAGKRRPFIRVGRGLALTAYGAIRTLTVLRVMKDRSITRSNLDSVLYGNRYSGAKIERFCGFEYTPIDRTIDRVVKNYLAEKKGRKAQRNSADRRNK